MPSSSTRQTLRKRAEALIGDLSSGPPSGAAELHRTAMSAHALALQAGDRLLEAEALLQLGRNRGPTADPPHTWSAMRQAEQIFLANGLVSKALTCRVAAARALRDLGEERNAVALLNEALREPLLSLEDHCTALVQLAVCTGQLGELDLAFEALRSALALADDCPAPLLRVQARWAWGLTHLQALIQSDFPALWRGLPDKPSTVERVRSPQEVVALFDQAMAAAPPGMVFGHFEVSRQVAVGLAGDLAAAERALHELARTHGQSDPPLSAWALFCQGVLLRHGGDEQAAVRVLGRAIALAQPVGHLALARDCLLMRSRAYEALGDAASSLAAYRRFSDLRVKSVMLSARAAPVAGVAPALAAEPSETPVGQAVALHRLRNLEPAYVRKAARFIEEGGGRHMPVDEVVAHCGVSRRTLETGFKSSKHSTVANYIKRCQLDHAAARLLDTDLRVQQIAAAVGYRSPGAFAREFRAMFGVSPTDWRRTRTA